MVFVIGNFAIPNIHEICDRCGVSGDLFWNLQVVTKCLFDTRLFIIQENYTRVDKKSLIENSVFCAVFEVWKGLVLIEVSGTLKERS